MVEAMFCGLMLRGLWSVCRLLAMEVYDTCNADGLYCNLITGALQRALECARSWLLGQQ